MLETDRVIDLVWPVGMLLVQKTIFTAALRTDRYPFAKIVRDFRTQAGVSGEPGLWLGSADARVVDSRQARLAHPVK
jgi:hypothetical protein